MTASTNPKHCGKPPKARLIKPWSIWMAMLLIALQIGTLSGCKTSVVAIPADNVIVPMPTGKAFTPTNGPGFFVPQAKMLEILTELERKP